MTEPGNGAAGVLPDIDLTEALAADTPAIRLPADRLSARSLSLGEWADAAHYGGVDPMTLSDVLAAGGEPMYRAIAAIAYVITRRIDPGFTWEQMHRYRVEVIGSPAAPPYDGDEWDRRIVALALATGWAPSLVREMTAAEARIVADMLQKRARDTRREQMRAAASRARGTSRARGRR